MTWHGPTSNGRRRTERNMWSSSSTPRFVRGELWIGGRLRHACLHTLGTMHSVLPNFLAKTSSTSMHRRI